MGLGSPEDAWIFVDNHIQLRLHCFVCSQLFPSSHKTSQFWKYATSRSVNHHFLIIFSYLPIFFDISHPFSIIFPAFSHISMAIKRSSSPKQPVARWPWWRCSPCPAPTWAVAAASVGPPVAAGTGSCRWNRAMWCPGHGGYGAAEFTPGFKRRKKGGISGGFFMISWKLSWEFHGNFMDPMEKWWSNGDFMVISRRWKWNFDPAEEGTKSRLKPWMVRVWRMVVVNDVSDFPVNSRTGFGGVT